MEKSIYNLNMNNLKYFYVVGKLGSFTKASEYFCISQPNISYAIKQLETYFDTKLVIRDSQGVKLTKIGQKIYNQVENIFGSIDNCLDIINDASETSFLSIGIQTHIFLALRDELNKFILDHPTTKIHFHQDATQELVEKLKSEKVDIVIDAEPISLESNDLLLKKIKEETMCFIAKSDSPEANLTSLEEVAQNKLILPAWNSGIRKSLEVILNEKSISCSPVFQTNSTEVAVDMVKSGLGIGYVLNSVSKPYINTNEIKKLEIDTELPKLSLCVVTHKDIDNPLINELINYLNVKE